MNTIAVACILALAYSTASPINKNGNERRYFPEEDDPLRIKYLHYQDENGTVHYEDLTSASLEERAIKPKDIKLYLYTRASEDFEVFQIGEAGNLIFSEFYDPKKDNFFLIHGWKNDYRSDVNVQVKRALLESQDLNVFVVDWTKQANKLYTSSKGSVTKIGQFVGQFVNSMMDIFKLSPKAFKMAGHSLGAHIAGNAGAEIKGQIDYIVGMDPASPLFTVRNTKNRLDSADADFVQIIHTSNFLGFQSSIGHSDLFPNDGHSQPGCGMNVMGICSHSRSYMYFAESLLTGGFHAKECRNWKDFKKGLCQENSSTYLGTLDIDKSAQGDFYLHVNTQSPFAAEE